MKTRLYLPFFAALYLIPLAGICIIRGFNLPGFSLLTYGNEFLALTAVAVIYAWQRGFSLKELGFRKDNLFSSLLVNLVVSLALCGVIFLLISHNPLRQLHLPMWNSYYVRYIILYCPTQEFIYRSLVFAEFKRARITNKFFMVVFSALTFCFAHILFLDPFTVGITFIAGIIWGITYLKKPNLWGVAVSHSILGVLTIATGLI